MNSFSDSKNVFGLWPKASHDARPSAERRLNTIHRDQSVRDGIRAASAERLRRAKVGTVGRISGTKTRDALYGAIFCAEKIVLSSKKISTPLYSGALVLFFE